jgi:hypothetical protein
LHTHSNSFKDLIGNFDWILEKKRSVVYVTGSEPLPSHLWNHSHDASLHLASLPKLVTFFKYRGQDMKKINLFEHSHKAWTHWVYGFEMQKKK